MSEEVTFVSKLEVDVVNYSAITVFLACIAFNINYVVKYKESRTFYSLTTIISCIVSMTFRIGLCIANLFLWQDQFLRRYIYQDLFFEIPFYCYMIVGFTIFFCWFQLQIFLTQSGTPGIEKKSKIIQNCMYAIIAVTVVILLVDTIFSFLQDNYGFAISAIFWGTSAILILLQFTLIIATISVYVTLTLLFHSKANITDQNRLSLINGERFEDVLAMQYQKIKFKFHSLFICMILITIIRTGLYVYLRIDFAKIGESIQYINVWKDIDPHFNYILYIIEFLINILLLGYFYYVNSDIQQKEDSIVEGPQIVETESEESESSSERGTLVEQQPLQKFEGSSSL